MELISVWLEGTNSIICNQFLEAPPKSTGPIEVDRGTPREQAEPRAYRDKKGHFGFPGAGIARLLRESGASHKQKSSRKSCKWIVPAAVLVMDDLLLLHEKNRKTKIKDYEVDSRPVVIPSTKGRIMRHRPRFDVWTLPVQLRINTDVLPSAFIRQLLVEGGERIGLGDYRPGSGGPFGTFALVSWDPIK